MKTAIFYASKTGKTRKIAKALAGKIKGEVITIPIHKAKAACLLKYDFIIIAGSIHYGRIQGEIKSFVNKNVQTLKGINYGLYITCINDEKSEEYLRKSFGEEILKSALVTASFGAEINLNEGDLITKHIIKSNLKRFKKENKEPPSIKWELVEEYADTINKKINK